MARRSQCSSQADNPLDPHYLPPHYREEYRLAIDALVEGDAEGYYDFLQNTDLAEFLCPPELEHILHTVQEPSQKNHPELPYVEDVDNASSDTYWPLNSDLEAPPLDLGWPALHSFVGPTEVTMLVNPSDPSMPSIKEQARRLINNAQQVIGVVMDIFSDIDIFIDLLNATMRNVAVYIVLDELNAHYFTAMATSCKINLDMVHLMRIRTVSGSTYFCRSGKSFRGRMMDRFLLVDCRAVLSGNYSFMWSFEKIHRCIAHLFLGELVTTYDEEFRILYAQSQPLTNTTDQVSSSGESGYGSHMTKSFREHQPMLASRYASNFRQPLGNKIDKERNFLPFRRDETFHNPLEHPSKHGRMDQSFVEQGRSMMTPWQMEMQNKRHSYAEGGHDSNRSSPRPQKRHQVRNNPDIEPQSAHHYREQQYYHGAEPGFGPGINSDSSSQGSSRTNQFFESGYLETPSPGSYGPRMDYMSPSSSRENIHELVNRMDPKRGGVSHLYGGQTSSQLLNPPLITEAGLNQQPQDTGTKQGLRKWRINSYLSALDDEDKGLPGPLESDPFEEPPRFPEENYAMELPAVKPNPQEFPMMAVRKDLISKYARTNQPDAQKAQTGKYAPVATDGKVATEVPEPSTATKDKMAGKEEVKEASESSTTKQESHPSRINPLFLRGSRLRSSLLFSSINFEQNDSTVKSSAEDNDKEEASEHLKSSVMTHILEKRPLMKREKIDWSSLRKTTSNENKGQKSEEQSSVPAESKTSADTQQSTVTTTASSEVTKGILMKPKDSQNISSKKELRQDDSNTEKQKLEKDPSGSGSMGQTDPKNLGENKPVNLSSERGTEVHKAPNQQSEESTEESSVKPPKDSVPMQKPKLTERTQLKVPPEREIIPVPTEPLPALPSFINMDDPDMRLLYFKRLAAERKAANKAKESTIANPDVQESKTGADHKTPSASQNLDNTDEKVADKSVAKKVPVVLEGVQKPTETQASKVSTSQLISNKPGESGLMDKELVRDSTATKTRPVEKISKYGVTSTDPVKSIQNKPISSVSDNRTAAHDVANQKSKGLMEESLVKSPVVPLPEETPKPEKEAQLKVPTASSFGLTHPEKPLQNQPLDGSHDNKTTSPETKNQKSKDATEKPKSEPLPKDPPRKETAPTESLPSTSSSVHENDQGVRSSDQSEKTYDGMKLAGESIVPANASLKKTAVSKIEKEPSFQGAARYPLEALANMPITNTSEKPILYKAEVTSVPEPKNKSPVVIPQSAVSDLRCKDSEPNVAVASNSSLKSVEKDSVKPPEGPQGPNISNSKGIDQHATDAEKQDFKKDTRNHASSSVLNDPGKLQEKPSHSPSGKGTAVLKVTEQKSVEATGQSMNLKSPKDHLMSHKPKPVETEQPNTAPVEKHVTTALKLPVPTASSSINDRETAGLSSKSLAVKQNNLEGPMGSVAQGPDLSKSTSDNSLKILNASQNLSEANLETTDISPMKKEPEIHKAAQNATETLTNNATDQSLLAQGESVPSKSEDLTQAVLKQQTELTREHKASQPHSNVPETTKDSVKSVEKDSKQVAEVASKEEKDDHKTHRAHSSAASKGSQSHLQTVTNSVIHSCNLKDDTKVILEQISANSQNRIDLTVSTEGTTDDAKMEKEKGSSDKKGIPESRLRGSRVQGRLDNRPEKEDLLKKMEKMRKEKKVYSRFELG